MNQNSIIIVSGLPRSGTSLMMQMLAAADIPILTDKNRKADANNPRGYFEWEAVKHLADDNRPLLGAQGKAVKIISHLLPFLPERINYKIIFMSRDLQAVIQSQNKMLGPDRKKKKGISNSKLRDLYRNHLNEIHFWLKQQNNCTYITIEYEHVLKKPLETALQVQSFLEIKTDTEAMARQVDSSLNHFPPPSKQEQD